MASWRARRILTLVSSPSTSQNQDRDVQKSDFKNQQQFAVESNTIKDNEENVFPNKNTPQKSDELGQLSNSCDEILSDDANCFSLKFDSQLISCDTKMKKSMFQTSLIPDYDSDNSFISENISIENIKINSENNQDIKKSPPKSSSSSSSSSSSTSTSSTSSSSSLDSDSSTSSKRTNQHSQDSSKGVHNSIKSDSIETENNDTLIFGNTSQPTGTEQEGSCSNSLRQQRSSNQAINISPIYTNESDIDLSDDDPTFNYEQSNNLGKKKNYFFERIQSADTLTGSSDSSSGSSGPINSRAKKITKKGRKRTRNPANWKQNKVKKLRNTGESYVSTSKTRKIIPSRCLKVPCTDKCKLKCTEHISINARYDIFKEFWNLGDLTKQRTYISYCMVDIAPKYRYTNAEKPRRPNKAYYFTVNNEKIRVCKTFFKSTLDISDRVIFTVQTKISGGGFMLDDLRGKHHSHKTINPELVDDIRQHIQSIPKIESHYLRATSTKEYIDGGKTIKDLYNDFTVQQEQNKKESGNYIAYYKIFTSEFNLSFFQPKKDQCDLCLSYNNSKDENKKQLEEKYNKHIEEKALSRIEKQEDRTNINKDNKVVIYDLEAVLQCPRGDTSAFYYKSKLNSYNLTLTELTKANSKTAFNKVHCYFWTESDAKRGAVEIGTCVLKYLEGICEETPEEKNIIFYSDNCCGQNKNKYIATLYLFAVQKFNIRTITHKFLIRGHTQNEADSVHSLIEKEVKKNLKSGPIYSPDQYITLIKNAKKSKPAINVHELTFDSFMDIKLLQEEWGYNYNTDTDGETVNWNNIKVLIMKKEKPFSIFCKKSYKDNCFREIDVRNKRKKMKLITEITLKKAYTKRQDLSINKKKDLRELINKGLIPQYYANFYNSIIN